MKIADVIEKVDNLQVNIFEPADKLRWCYEVTTDILADCPEFDSVTETVMYDGAIVSLPEGVDFSHVARVYVNGVPKVLRDERTLADTELRKGDVVNVVYRVVPKEYALDGGVVPDTYETACPAPWDAMYIDYVCAQMAYHQNDLADYEKYIQTYNVRFESYKKWFGSNSPVSDRKNFVNLY